MKNPRWIMLLAMIASLTTSVGQTPNANEWLRQKKTQRQYLVQQVAALKVYLNYLKKGYQIADKGLTAIGDIKDGTFNLDKDYFNSLRSVSPAVRKSPKVNQILLYTHNIESAFRKFVYTCKRDDQLTTDEVDYIESLQHRIVNECQTAIDALTLITTAGETEMEDAQRLERLDNVHRELQALYAFTQDFIDTTNLLSIERRKEKKQVNAARERTGTRYP